MADTKKKVQLEDITPGNLLKYDPATNRYSIDEQKSAEVSAAIREALQKPK
jgi:hypothetical protein